MISRLFFTVLMAALGFAAAVFFQVVPVPFQSSSDLACEINERLADRRAQEAEPTANDPRIKVMMMRLKGDSADNKARGLFIDSVRGPYGDTLLLIESCRVLEATASDPDTLRRTAKMLLEKRGADMLVYGRYNGDKSEYGLRISAGVKATNQLSSYRTEEFVVEETFIEDFAAVLTAELLGEASSLNDGDGVQRLEPIANELKQQLDRFSDRVDTDHMQSLRFVYRRVLSILYSETDSESWTEAALSFERAETAAGRGTVSPDPWARAGAHYYLGQALTKLSFQRGGDIDLMEQSVDAYRQSVVGTEGYQLAVGRFGLGTSLWSLGMVRGDDASLEEAIAVYQDALREFDKRKSPLLWARTQAFMGVVMLNLGSRRQSEPLAEQALTALTEALREYEKQGEVIYWADTYARIGDTLQLLARLQKDQSVFEDALGAYEQALSGLDRKNEPTLWAYVHDRRGDAFARLGTMQDDNAFREKAIASYRQALLERTAERDLDDWVNSQNGLGRTLLVLGMLKKDDASVNEAILIFEQTVLARDRENDPLLWARSNRDLGYATRERGLLRNDPADLEAAIAMFDESHAIFVAYDETSDAELTNSMRDLSGRLLERMQEEDNVALPLDNEALRLNAAIVQTLDCDHSAYCTRDSRWRGSDAFRTQP
ncbi:MAG: hypothetical protein AAFX52_03490 [Pseudomonadota bacterium]